MKRNEIYLSFGIFDFEDITHSEITNLLGIEPSHVRIKGYPRNPKNIDGPVITNNSWRMSSGLDEFADFDEQLNATLISLNQKSISLNLFVKNIYVSFPVRYIFILTMEKARHGYI